MHGAEIHRRYYRGIIGVAAMQFLGGESTE